MTTGEFAEPDCRLLAVKHSKGVNIGLRQMEKVRKSGVADRVIIISRSDDCSADYNYCIGSEECSRDKTCVGGVCSENSCCGQVPWFYKEGCRSIGEYIDTKYHECVKQMKGNCCEGNECAGKHCRYER